MDEFFPPPLLRLGFTVPNFAESIIRVVFRAFPLVLFGTFICGICAARADDNPEVLVGAAEKSVTGESIYRAKCQSCHGPAGEGTKKYKKALTGDLSVGQLSQLIDETMPEEDPDQCVGEEATKVADYIYNAFYSTTAQARNKPPRIEIVRLTNRQYQNAVMDLVGSFRSSGQTPEMKGLKGEYFSSRQFRREARVIERVDPVIRFNFGERRPHDPPVDPMNEPKQDEAKKQAAEVSSNNGDGTKLSFGPQELALADPPGKPAQINEKPAEKNSGTPAKPDVKALNNDKPVTSDAAKTKENAKPSQSEEELKKKIEEEKRRQREREQKQREEQKKKDEEARQFGIRWQGSVFPTETGDFEFVVRTENAFRLWVNDNEKPMIDAWVKSGDDKEFRQTIKLVAGRGYAMRLEMFKFREPTASIELAWRRPGSDQVESITERFLSPTWNPKRFVATASFPPDDRSFGYERGISVSKAWENATTDAAIETVNHVIANLNELAGIKKEDGDDAKRTKIREFAGKFLERAFRRPLDENQRKLYLDKQFEQNKDVEQALRRVVLLALKSPRFLYLEMHGSSEPDSYDLASRLSFALWDSIPDTQLMDAASKNLLTKPEQIEAQAQRMGRDPRTQQKLREFLMAWLKLEGSPDLAKDPKVFANFTPEVIGDLKTSLEMSLNTWLQGDKADLRALLSSPEWYANGRLAKVYGLKLPEDAGFQKVGFDLGTDPAKRSGIITHPYILAHLAYTQTTSPIHRGVFLARNILGRSIKPPPIAVSPIAPDLHPNLTTRERTILQTSPSACVSCHSAINPLGFGLEQFDAIGRYRSQEKDKPVDASGEYLMRSGETAKFNDAVTLAQFLVKAEETQTSLVQQVFHHTAKQPIMAYGTDTVGNLQALFVRDGFDLKRLMVRSAVAATLNTKTGHDSKAVNRVATVSGGE